MAMTYEDYMRLGHDHPRCELVDGVIRLMASPESLHQKLSVALTKHFLIFLEGKTCELYYAPIDVYLDADLGKRQNVFQPDMIVVCDTKKIKRKGCFGAPDLIVEILSKSTGKYDMTVKYDKYQENGVKEYWIVNPDHNLVQLFVLVDGLYQSRGFFSSDDVIKSEVLPGLEIDLAEVFPPDDFYDDDEE